MKKKMYFLYFSFTSLLLINSAKPFQVSTKRNARVDTIIVSDYQNLRVTVSTPIEEKSEHKKMIPTQKPLAQNIIMLEAKYFFPPIIFNIQ